MLSDLLASDERAVIDRELPARLDTDNQGEKAKLQVPGLRPGRLFSKSKAIFSFLWEHRAEGARLQSARVRTG